MILRAVLAAGGLLAVCLCASPARAEEHFSGRLDTVPIDGRTQATITGGGRIVARLDGSELVVDGNYEGLAGAATVARLHIGPAIGARGPAAHELEVSRSANGSVRGSVRLNRREVDALRSGRVYVQIHSQPAPDGNLWGWLLPEE